MGFSVRIFSRGLILMTSRRMIVSTTAADCYASLRRRIVYADARTSCTPLVSVITRSSDSGRPLRCAGAWTSTRARAGAGTRLRTPGPEPTGRPPSVSASEEELGRASDSEGEQAARSSDEDDEGVLDRSRLEVEVPAPRRAAPTAPPCCGCDEVSVGSKSAHPPAQFLD